MASTPIIVLGVVVAIICVAGGVIYGPDLFGDDAGDDKDGGGGNGGEDAPVAIIDVEDQRTDVRVYEVINFTGNNSYDPDGGEIRLFTWNFDDGIELKGGYEVSNVSHNFSTPGTFTVTLIVSDDEGISNKTTVNITVSPLDATYHYTFQLATIGGIINSAERNFTVLQDAKFIFMDFTFVNLQEAHLEIVVNNPLGTTIYNESDITVNTLSFGTSHNITLKEKDLLYDGDYEVQVTIRDTESYGEAVSVDLYIEVKYQD